MSWLTDYEERRLPAALGRRAAAGEERVRGARARLRRHGRQWGLSVCAVPSRRRRALEELSTKRWAGHGRVAAGRPEKK